MKLQTIVLSGNQAKKKRIVNLNFLKIINLNMITIKMMSYHPLFKPGCLWVNEG